MYRKTVLKQYCTVYIDKDTVYIITRQKKKIVQILNVLLYCKHGLHFPVFPAIKFLWTSFH